VLYILGELPKYRLLTGVVEAPEPPFKFVDALIVKADATADAFIFAPAKVVVPANVPTVKVNPFSDTAKVPLPVVAVTPFAAAGGVAVLGLSVWTCGGRLAAVSVRGLIEAPPV
jgi:hypothetical protein